MVLDIRIPNLVRALIGAFSQNLVNFNDITGRGYAYVADKIIEIDAFNPSISSLLARSFKLYPRTDSLRRGLIEKELKRIMGAGGLSKNTHEIVANTLGFGRE